MTTTRSSPTCAPATRSSRSSRSSSSFGAGADLVGLGWRPETAGLALARRDLGFVEVVAESIDPDADLPVTLRLLRDRDIPVIPHGVRLSLAGAEPPDPARVDALAAVAHRLDAPMVSEHLAFVRAGGIEAGHLLAAPLTRDALAIVVDNVRRAQDRLPVALALEPIASLFTWPGRELDEATFIAEVLDRTGALLLLDVANVVVNAANFGFDPRRFVDALPLERLAYVHIAGGIRRDGLWHDTHAHPIWPEALDLLAHVTGRVPAVRVLLERDDDYPDDTSLGGELDRVADAIAFGRSRRSPDRAPPERAAPAPAPAPSPTVPGASNDAARARLADQQLDLVRALVAGADAPVGFDPSRLDATGLALRHKRSRAVESTWPDLARVIGPSFPSRFAAWARDRQPETASADAFAFALDHRDALDHQGLRHLVMLRAQHHRRGGRRGGSRGGHWHHRRVGLAAERAGAGRGLVVAFALGRRAWTWPRH